MSKIALTIIAAIAYTPAAPSMLQDNVAEAKTAHVVFGGRCSRSIQEVANFESHAEACRKAASMRSEYRYVGVVTGKVDSALFLLAPGDDWPAIRSCRVYSIRDDQVQWEATTRTSRQALALAKMIRDQEGVSEVVYEFEEN